MSTVLPLYLAMTAAEIQNSDGLPGRIAWMACHFSPYGRGISNAPSSLPPGSALILNDRIPPSRHDPAAVAEELAAVAEQTGAERLLLDFQRPNMPLLQEIAQAITEKAVCPVAVTEAYGQGLSCGLFILPELHKPLSEQLQARAGREIWLEAATECWEITVTDAGCQLQEKDLPTGDFPHTDELLCCRYRTRVERDRVRFTLLRDRARLNMLLQQAAQLSVPCAFGLCQQLKETKTPQA